MHGTPDHEDLFEEQAEPTNRMKIKLHWLSTLAVAMEPDSLAHQIAMNQQLV